MTVDISRVIARALQDLGRGEATGRNDGPYVAAVLGEHQRLAWCAAWVMRAYEWAGYPFARLDRRGPPELVDFWACRAVAELARQLEARGCRVGAGDRIEPGDLCIQLGRVANAGATGHVDLVTEVVREPDALIVRCVGGNVANAVRRSQRRAFAPEVTSYMRPRRILES